jgi:hypothetical protein
VIDRQTDSKELFFSVSASLLYALYLDKID